MMDSDLEDELFAMVNNNNDSIRRDHVPARHQKQAPARQPAAAGRMRLTKLGQGSGFCHSSSFVINKALGARLYKICIALHWPDTRGYRLSWFCFLQAV
jgi:hypothetical protein